jgi:putative peptidoglycan lipid II flippase
MKQTIQLGSLSAANTVLSFVFQWYVLTQLGAGAVTDAFFAGMTVPQLVLVVISGSLTHVLVPVLAVEDSERQLQNAWSLIILVGGLFGLIATFLCVTVSNWVPLIVPGFDNAGKNLTEELTRIQLIGMVFAAINGVQCSVYYARHQFIWVELVAIISSLIALPFLVWALPKFGIIVAVWISTLRLVLQTILLTYGMGRPVCPDLHSVAVKLAWLRIKPLIIGAAYYKTDPLVDRFMLSSASSGSLSLYFLAQQIYGAISHVLEKAVASPLIPILSKLYKQGNKVGFRQVYIQKVRQIVIFGLICVILIIFFGQVLLTLVIGHGNINSDNINELWWIMIWLSGMFVGGVAGQISSSAYYASGDTKTPTRIGIYSYTLYIPLKIIFFYFFGVMGLAITTSVYLLVNLFFQNYFLFKNNIKL